MRGFLFGLFCLFLSTATAQADALYQPLTLPVGPGSRVFHFGDVTLHVTVPDPAEKAAYVFTVTSPEALPATLRLPQDPAVHEFPPVLSQVEMDRANATPEFLISRFSGGAHCCAVIQILDLVGGAWTVVQGGSWNGSEIVPRDMDGDGEAEIVHGDDRFLYVFSCYACSGAPPRYFKLVEGALVDVTASPLFRPHDEQVLPNFRQGCANHDNGACAGYVALMTRLGRRQQGWNFMLKNYDPTQDWGLSDCMQYDDSGKCTALVRYKNYPAALDALLQRTSPNVPAP